MGVIFMVLMVRKREDNNIRTSMDSEELVSVSSLYAVLMPLAIDCDADVDAIVVGLGVVVGGAGVDTDG